MPRKLQQLLETIHHGLLVCSLDMHQNGAVLSLCHFVRQLGDVSLHAQCNKALDVISTVLVSVQDSALLAMGNSYSRTACMLRPSQAIEHTLNWLQLPLLLMPHHPPARPGR